MALRVLYVGQLFPGATCLQRLEAAREAGCEVIPFDTTPLLHNLPLIPRVLGFRLTRGPAVTRFNTELLAAAERTDIDWLWIDKGTWVRPETLERIHKRNQPKLIHYTPDAALVLNKTPPFVDSIPVYDALITTKSYELDLYRQHGARKLIFQQQGYDPRLFRPVTLSAADQARFGADVTLVAHHENHYAATMCAAATTGANVALWGPDWEKAVDRDPRLKAIYRGGPLYLDDYVKALNAGKIYLGVLSKRNLDVTTTRTFEIPACGGFLLAERTDEHVAHYQEGIEAEFYSTPEEMCEKIRTYLADGERRKRVAAAGRARCLKDGGTYLDRFRQVLDQAREWGWIKPDAAPQPANRMTGVSVGAAAS